MVDIIDPAAPTITIKIGRSGQLSLSTPDDKMLALAMLSIATAMIQSQIMGHGALQMPASLPV